MKRLYTGILLLVATFASAEGGRIVSLGGVVSETVAALGAADRLVGVDLSSLYPAEIMTKLPQVGYVRQLSAEGVLSLAPDLILAIQDAGPPAVVNQLKGSGVSYITLPKALDAESAGQRILAIGEALGLTDKAQALVKGMEKDLAAARSQASARKGPAPRVVFVYARGAGTLLVSGTGTEADAMIRLAGGVNAVTGYSDYRPLTAEALVEAKPDVLLFLSGGLESLGGKSGVMNIPALAQTPAAQKGRIVALDDLYLLGFGPRLGQATLDLAQEFAKP